MVKLTFLCHIILSTLCGATTDAEFPIKDRAYPEMQNSNVGVPECMKPMSSEHPMIDLELFHIVGYDEKYEWNAHRVNAWSKEFLETSKMFKCAMSECELKSFFDCSSPYTGTNLSVQKS